MVTIFVINDLFKPLLASFSIFPRKKQRVIAAATHPKTQKMYLCTGPLDMEMVCLRDLHESTPIIV